ncbi:HPr family phosphocarrier protein [Streptomyces sp. NPDC005811]|uniref:HPr family phosphocarrier protein n=1 Tax=Streptomyces sp. NPDC005811 TaxID=3154565 RepID=UPI0033F2A256
MVPIWPPCSRAPRRPGVYASSDSAPGCRVCVVLPEDLHARPAGRIATTTPRFTSTVRIGYEGCSAAATSVLALMALGPGRVRPSTSSPRGPTRRRPRQPFRRSPRRERWPTGRWATAVRLTSPCDRPDGCGGCAACPCAGGRSCGPPR